MKFSVIEWLNKGLTAAWSPTGGARAARPARRVRVRLPAGVHCGQLPVHLRPARVRLLRAPPPASDAPLGRALPGYGAR
eukprot:1176162-Prorocentrum_minimum.AAC.3